MKNLTPSDRNFPIDRFLWELKTIINMDSGTADVEGCRQVAAFFEAHLKAAGLTVDCIPYGKDQRPLVLAVSPGASIPDLKTAPDVTSSTTFASTSATHVSVTSASTTLINATPASATSGIIACGSAGVRDAAVASRGNRAVATSAAAKTFDFLLVGHLDTVFAKGTAARRPFRLDQEAGRAYGPGTVDMKAGALLMVYIAEYLTRQAPQISLCLALNSDEETGSVDSAPLLMALGRRARRAFVFEGGRKKGQFVHQRKGCLKYEIEISGIASHAGTAPQQGASAIVEMAHLILKLDKLKRYDRGTSVNVGLTQGGTALNVVADHAVSQMEVRYTSESERKRIEKSLSKLQSSSYVSGTTITMTRTSATPPLNLTQKTAEMMVQMEEYGRIAQSSKCQLTIHQLAAQSSKCQPGTQSDNGQSDGGQPVDVLPDSGLAGTTERAEIIRQSEGTSQSGGIRQSEGTSQSGGIRQSEGTSQSGGIRQSEGTSQSGGIRLAGTNDGLPGGAIPPVAFVSAGGLSDANRLALCDIPVIDGCGPSGGFPHSEKEFLSIDTVERRFRFMCGVMQYIYERST